ncbi:MAG: YicC family protein [Bacteroidetes bacterium]|nr:MAG: YicC family protein [Bacteroidota bacterium]REK00659.1 MAG: YicC family protein [Bacteroidota bacterium]REK35219.1 MAG: YicC family protein [Bacteroidota bacterium]REK48296.1 MAG: YicC family protein [Bacteroidota bacterium]
MIRSMTGFGSSSASFNSKTISVEIKSVNSKFFDPVFRLPSLYREKEFELRSELAKHLERGKMDFAITIDQQELPKKSNINSALVKSYYTELKEISSEVGVIDTDILSIVMKFPDVLSSEKQIVSDEEWAVVKDAIDKAVASFQEFRMKEGNVLEKDLQERISSILELLIKIESLEDGRVSGIRQRLGRAIEEISGNPDIDRNRLEQEMIYYIEKLDISEEKVRLRSHCDFFLGTIKSESSAGKKLSFISQEIGREINTIGSKANDAGIQKLVVGMKDELEKVKEQLLNIL